MRSTQNVGTLLAPRPLTQPQLSYVAGMGTSHNRHSREHADHMTKHGSPTNTSRIVDCSGGSDRQRGTSCREGTGS